MRRDITKSIGAIALWFGLAASAVAACGHSADSVANDRRLRLWHTFNPTETEALNAHLQRRGGMRVETTLLPFQRGQTILHGILVAGEDCPDLVRADATWIPGLARDGLLTVAPDAVASAWNWLPEPLELARDRDVQYALPQSLDGLALIARAETITAAGVDWPPRTVGALLASARRMTGDGTHGLGVRVDGYWFVAFLRAWGGDVINANTGALNINTPLARRALERFADLFGPAGVAGLPPPSGNEAQDEIRRFRAGELAAVLNGPWAATALGGGDTRVLRVDAFPPARNGRGAAPRGGQMFIVPRCAKEQAAAWKLALELTEPSLQADWARRFGVVPTTRGGLADAGSFSQSFYAALQAARPLPRHPISAEMFDDLNPAIAAVVAGDATADEALAGVERAWTRLFQRHGITAKPSPDAGSPQSLETDAGLRPRAPGVPR